MTQEKRDYKREISELLDNYVDGRDIFKKAKDWDYPVTRKPESAGKSLPETWLELADKVISIVAHGKYGLDTYPNIIEIVDSNQMRDAYTSVGMPVSYDHWSHGKQRMSIDKAYEGGEMGLAYEMVINSSPSIAYCMEQNSKTMQMLVIAHASYGHNSFFKNNHMFKQFTNAHEIIGDLNRLNEFIRACEEKHGVREVERILDACHALESHGVNRYKRPVPRTPEQEKERRALIEEMRQQSIDHVMDGLTGRDKKMSSDFKKASNDNEMHIPPDMEENLLRYIASDAPHLKGWERGIISMISDRAQYFYPQGQTKVMNEGWASFWHYTLMHDLHEELDLIDDGMWMEFIKSHTGVLFQPDFDSPYFSGINPYALGFAIFSDIKRMCLDPTDEDREFFPAIAGKKDWLPILKDAAFDFKDESFILQFLSPKVMRDLHLFSFKDDAAARYQEITAIHDDSGFRKVREVLASQYRLGDEQPRIEVAGYDYKGNRSLTLRHTMHNGRPVDEDDMREVLKHVHQLWQHPVILESATPSGEVISVIDCPPSQRSRKKTAPTQRP